MSNADQLAYFKMEEQIATMSKKHEEHIHPIAGGRTIPNFLDAPQPTIKVNAQGEIIFDETSLGVLDEHIRTVVRKEIKAMKDEVFREFEIYLAQRLRNTL